MNITHYLSEFDIKEFNHAIYKTDLLVSSINIKSLNQY